MGRIVNVCLKLYESSQSCLQCLASRTPMPAHRVCGCAIPSWAKNEERIRSFKLHQRNCDEKVDYDELMQRERERDR